MANDEIFVLILVSVCVAIVVAMSFRSRRRAATTPSTAEPAVTFEEPARPEEPAEQPRRRKRR